MRKFKAFITAIVLTVTLTAVHAEEVRAYDQCSGTYTSEMKKPVKIKESKLTSLSYVKKICNITYTDKREDSTAYELVYELDNGNGVFCIARDNKVKTKTKACVIVKDGELYGRIFAKIDIGIFIKNGKGTITVAYNLHDKECSIKGFKATEEEIIHLTSELSKVLSDVAKEVGLSLN